MADKEPLKKRIEKYLDKIDLVSFANTEYEAGLSEELDPIAKIGFDPEVVETIKENREGFNPDTTDNAYYNLDGEGGVSIGSNLLSSKAVISHEFRHRGFAVLSSMYEENPKGFSEEYGQGAVEILKRFMDYNSVHELDNEMWDNIDEEFINPKGKTTSYADHHENKIEKTRKFQAYRSGEDKGTSDEDKEFFDSYLELERAASDMLEEKRTDGSNYEPQEGLSGPEGWAKNITDKVTKKFNQGGIVESNEDYFARLQKEIEDEASGVNTQSVAEKYNAEMDDLEKRIKEMGLVKGNDITATELASFALDFVPLVGDIKGALDTASDIYLELKKEEPNYTYVGILATTGIAATAVGTVPFVGDAAAMALRKGARKFGLEDKYDLALKTVDENQDKIVGEITETLGRETVDAFGRGIGGAIKDSTEGLDEAVDFGAKVTSGATQDNVVASFASKAENDPVGNKMSSDNSFGAKSQGSDVVGSKMDRDNSFSGRSQSTESESPTTESQTSRAFFKGGLATSEEEPVLQMSEPETTTSNVIPDIISRPTKAKPRNRLDIKRRVNKGMSYPELIYDNVIGTDNDYDSFGEQMARAFNEDEIGFVKTVGTEMAKGAWDFIKSPVEGTKEIVKGIYDSSERLATDNIDSRLQDMFGVSYEEATDEQVNKVRESTIGDTLTVSELIPAAGLAVKGGSIVGKSAINAISKNSIAKEGWKPVGEIPTPQTNVGVNNGIVQKPVRNPDDVLTQAEVSPFILEVGKSDGFYSTVVTGIKNMPISKKKGITGHMASKYLSKKINTSQTALHWSGILNDLDSPENRNKTYTRPELVKLAEEVMPNVKVYKKNYEGRYNKNLDDTNIGSKRRSEPRYLSTQRIQRFFPDIEKIENPQTNPAGYLARSRVEDLETEMGAPDNNIAQNAIESLVKPALEKQIKNNDDYVELLAVNTNPRGVGSEMSESHWGQENVLAHARVSYYSNDPSVNLSNLYMTKKRDYAVLEEIQSDMVQETNVVSKQRQDRGETNMPFEDSEPRFANSKENLYTNSELRDYSRTNNTDKHIEKDHRDRILSNFAHTMFNVSNNQAIPANFTPEAEGSFKKFLEGINPRPGEQLEPSQVEAGFHLWFREMRNDNSAEYQMIKDDARNEVNEGYISETEVPEYIEERHLKYLEKKFNLGEEGSDFKGAYEYIPADAKEFFRKIQNPEDSYFLAAVSNYVFGEDVFAATNNHQFDDFNDYIDYWIPSDEPDVSDISMLKRTDTTRMSVLMAMRDAKAKGINVMYVPSPSVISQAHSFPEEMAENVYTDSLNKALNIINSQTKGKLKVSKENPPNVLFTGEKVPHYNRDNVNIPELELEVATKIDFSDIDIPEGPVSFNYNKGGLVPKPERV